MSDKRDTRVLIVEDLDDHQNLIRDAVVKGCQIKSSNITLAKTLNVATMTLSSSKTFDIVLLDLNLPDSRGMETLHKLRKKEPSVAIIVLTSLGEESMGSTAIMEGAQDFVSKSDLNPGLLEKSIRHSIERKKVENQLQTKIQELEDFNTLAIGREKRIIELKQEVNTLLQERGDPPAYDLSFLQEVDP